MLVYYQSRGYQQLISKYYNTEMFPYKPFKFVREYISKLLEIKVQNPSAKVDLRWTWLFIHALFGYIAFQFYFHLIIGFQIFGFDEDKFRIALQAHENDLLFSFFVLTNN